MASGLSSGPNESERVWGRRLQHRINGRDAARSGAAYLAYRVASSVLADEGDAVARSPDPHARQVTKRQWEASMMHWRHAYRCGLDQHPLEHCLADVSLVDSLRQLGIPVPYIKSGPFLAESDGNVMLHPWRLRLISVDLAVEPEPGRYVLWHAPHFVPCFVVDGGVMVGGPLEGWRSQRLESRHLMAWKLTAA